MGGVQFSGNGNVSGATFNGNVNGNASYATNADYINVKQYGAMGNNSSDDTVAIQTAINAAEATGHPLYIPTGTYLISSALYITNYFSYMTLMYAWARFPPLGQPPSPPMQPIYDQQCRC